ncbi:MoaD/ThiS family protein [Halomicroarcula limicola]|uniref:MoaD/ThiS family protein n=1 Tax=Haloarcula limicola TaxID=1429915 RepID=A0A8J8C8U5_9EURY|nr:MoaD/ThiS family protein [Halomicroarcula limicola]MBV0924925.1 MoaD/ThiS family protein [Halomicroarcula limicola]
MRVTVYGQLRSATGEKTVSVDFEGGTVRDALSAFADEYRRAERQLFEGDDVAPSVRLAVDGEAVDPDDDCPPDAELAVHPPMRGG